MTLTTTTEHHLSKADLALADEIAMGMEDVEGQMLNICYRVAKACDQRDDRFIQPFLDRALPSLNPGARRNVLLAGKERMRCLKSARQRAQLASTEYGWTLLAEIHSLPESHKDWAYEEKRTREEIRQYKRSLKTNVTPEQAEQKAKDYQEMYLAALGSVALYQSENQDLREQLTNLQSNDTQQVPTPLPQHDPATRAVSNPQKVGSARLEMGDEAVDDFNRVHQLLDEVSAIEGKYFCRDIWRRAEWESIYGAHYAASATSNAQRNYKSGSESGPVIDV